MADLQSALYARLTGDAELSAAIGTRAYWVQVPKDTALPYIRMQTISDPRPQNLTGYDTSRRTRVQVDVFAARYSEARAISRAVIDAVKDPAQVAGVSFGRTSATGPIDLGEDTPEGFIYRLRTDLTAEHSII